jgi:hypothetical protein
VFRKKVVNQEAPIASLNMESNSHEIMLRISSDTAYFGPITSTSKSGSTTQSSQCSDLIHTSLVRQHRVG